MRSSRFTPLALSFGLAFTVCGIAAPAVQDSPPIDPAQLLLAVKALKEAQSTQAKTARQAVLKTAQAAAASPSAAVAAWMEAVRQTQFEGAEKEGAQFREWKEKEGAYFSEKEVQNATQFYFRWLAITAQHAMGTPAKDLLPNILQYTKDVVSDSVVMEGIMEHAQKEKERANTKPGGGNNNNRNVKNANEDDRIRKVHDQILNRPLQASPPVKALHAEEVIKGEDKWEMQPGDIDGIYNTIILPEFRTAHDQRALEYWDMKIKLEGDVAKTKPAYDQEKFTKERRPELQWSRAKELTEIGLRNRGFSEMFQLLRANAAHPKFSAWVDEFEAMVSPAPAGGTGAAAQPASALPGAK